MPPPGPASGTCPAGTRLRRPGDLPVRGSPRVSCPPASIAKTSPPATIGAVRSRRRLASPSAEVDRPDQLRHRPQRRVDQPARQRAVAVGPVGVRSPPPARATGCARDGLAAGRLVRPHRDALAGEDRVLAAAGERQHQRQRGERRASRSAGIGQPSSAAGSAVDRRRPPAPPAARSRRRRRRSAAGRAPAAPRWRSARRARRRGRRSPPSLSPASRCISARCSSASGRNGASGATSPSSVACRSEASIAGAEQHHPLQRRERPPERRAPRRRRRPRRAAAAAPSRSPAASRLPACGQPRQHRRLRRRRGEGGERLGALRRVGLGERRAQRVAGRGRRRPLRGPDATR